jgi:uncharacterized protein YcfL
MKTSLIVILAVFLIFLCGCSSVPGSCSVQKRFLREHPNATILSVTTNDEFVHHAHAPTRCYADFGFVYRNADGAEHEEVWHYNRSTLVKKEQIR